MNLIHKEAIARNLIKSLAQLLDATVEHQIVTDSYGKDEKRVIITYHD